MELTHTFRIPVPVDEAWTVLRDIQRVGPCMPGATIDSVDGDDFTGGVKVKVGPITMTYKGEASFVDVDESQHRAAIEAKGRETRGSGTARATVRAQLRPEGGETEVTLVTDLAVTGKPAQFGRGVMADVGNKLVGQFADCLSAELARPAVAVAAPALGPDGTQPVTDADLTGPAGPAAGTPEPTVAAGDGASATNQPDEAIDLLEVAGTPLLKRLAPVAGALAGLLVLLWLLGRRRRGRRADPIAAAKQAAAVERKVAKLAARTAKAERRVARQSERGAKAAERTVRAEERRVAAQRRLAELETEAPPVQVVEAPPVQVVEAPPVQVVEAPPLEVVAAAPVELDAA